MHIKEIHSKKQKVEISTYILKSLPNYHRQGIGRALINWVIEWSKERGYYDN